jgi:KaiC/GvpD/RAD55 family RecA-like ATPase
VATEESRDDVLTETDEYVMELTVPDDFSKTTVNLMEKYIHEFLVYRVLADWMSITNLKNAASAQNWQAKLEEIKDEIESTLNAHRYRTRRTMNPF